MSNQKVILVEGCGTPLGCDIICQLSQDLKDQNFLLRAGFLKDTENCCEKVKQVGAEVMHLDIEKDEECNSALNDVTTLVIIPPYKENRVQSVNHFVDLAVTKNVKHIILISVIGADLEKTKFQKDMKLIEDYIKGKSDVTFTFLRCGTYWENLLLQSKLIKEGKLMLPIGNSMIAPVSHKDVAQVVSKVIKSPGIGDNKTYDITGPELLSGDQIAEQLNQKLNLNVKFMSPDTDEFKKCLKELGLSEDKCESLCEVYEWHKGGEAKNVSSELESTFGTKAISPGDFMESHREKLVTIQPERR
jgi:uncharacterized protein YbjT (DUF2867 family)